MSAHDRYLDPHDALYGTTPACETCDAPDPVETITEPNGAVVNVCRECHDEYLEHVKRG